MHALPSITLVLAGEFEERIEGVAHDCAFLDVIFKPANVEHANQYGRQGAKSLLIEIDGAMERRLSPFVPFDETRARVKGGIVAAQALQLLRAVRSGDATVELLVEELTVGLIARAGPREIENRSPDRCRGDRKCPPRGQSERFRVRARWPARPSIRPSPWRPRSLRHPHGARMVPVLPSARWMRRRGREGWSAVQEFVSVPETRLQPLSSAQPAQQIPQERTLGIDRKTTLN